MTAFVTVLLGAGWRYGDTPSTSSLAAASGTAFAVIAVAPDGQRLRLPQRDQTVTRLALGSNPALLVAVAVELALLLAFLGIPQLSDLLGGGWPSTIGWLWAGGAATILLTVDAIAKKLRRVRDQRG